MVRKAKTAKAEKALTRKKRKAPDAVRKASSPPKPTGDKPRGAPPKPIGDKGPSPTKPVGDKEASPTKPVGDKGPSPAAPIAAEERSDVPPKPTADKPPDRVPQEKPRDEKQPRFRVGKPSNPFLVLHPPPRLGRRR